MKKESQMQRMTTNQRQKAESNADVRVVFSFDLSDFWFTFYLVGDGWVSKQTQTRSIHVPIHWSQFPQRGEGGDDNCRSNPHAGLTFLPTELE
jgi:hypothetical protein